MLENFINKIVSLSDEEQIKVEDYSYIKEGYNKYFPPEVEVIKLSTLQGFCDFVPTINKEDGLFIIVDSPEQVRLVSDIDSKYKDRQTYCTAILDRRRLEFHWRNTEDFNIFLQANFEHTEHKDNILKLIGNLTDEEVNNYSDNGITQTTTKKTGISRKENVDIPNPVFLAPYRTFIDVKQPESMFILRMRSNGVPESNLFCADGDLWKVKAINNIKEYLYENITNIPIIG